MRWTSVEPEPKLPGGKAMGPVQILLEPLPRESQRLLRAGWKPELR